MGADNLAQFHLWQRWDWIMRTVPICVLARPGHRISARTAKAAQVFEGARCPAMRPATALCGAPAWVFLNVPMVDVSSTEIRARGDWSVLNRRARGAVNCGKAGLETRSPVCIVATSCTGFSPWFPDGNS
jgi:hypothetical protein